MELIFKSYINDDFGKSYTSLDDILKQFPDVHVASLSDDYGHCSTQMSIEQLKVKMNQRNISYVVNVVCRKIRVFPQVNVNHASFQREVASYTLD